ncbi:MAG: branched-chain amino acid ABC transporter substrate-binding protein [Firmicutes bacterium]|nr:branched-chain amino acid ABC transporter substrate-binding protein [Bacillota bacterium]
MRLGRERRHLRAIRKLLLATSLPLALLAAACGGGGGTAPAGGGGSSAQGGIPAGDIKIGIQAPLTRDYALEGQGFQKAIQLLADQINAQGGIDGHKIQVVAQDDQGTAQQAAVAAQKLVTEGVVAVVGGYNSTATEAAQPIYNQNKVIQITPASTAVQLSQKGYKYFFRTATLDSAQGKFAADLMVKTLGFQKIALLHDNSTYALGLAQATEQAVKADGGQVVFFDAIVPGSNDFGAVLTRLKAQAPQAVYFTGYFSDAGLLLKQSQAIGLKTQWIGGDANNNPQLIQVAGPAAEGFLVTTPPQPQDLKTPEAEQFVQQYQQKYGEMPPSVWTISAADAFRVIVDAIQKTHSTDPDKLAAYLHQLKDFPGFTGPISFAANGDREGTLHKAYIVKDGKFVLYDKQPNE